MSNDSYCMDVDKIVYRIDANGNLRVVGIYELIRWGWQHDLDDILVALHLEVVCLGRRCVLHRHRPS